MAKREGISGPYLTAAFLCEKVLMENDNVPTYVRVIDRFNIPKPQLPPGFKLPPGVQIPPVVIQFNLVVILKSGDVGTGKFNMRITLSKPDGQSLPAQTFSIFFQGPDDNGVQVVAPITIPNPDEGLHWFDVYFEEELITRTPMRVLFLEQAIPTS